MGNSIVSKLVFPIPDGQASGPLYKIKDIPSTGGRGSTGYNIPFFVVPGVHSDWCILYSHGNAENLDEVYIWCKEISEKLGCAVIAYDYCGYGAHRIWCDGTHPSEQNVYDDIKDIYDFARDKVASKVVIWGRSLGAAPTIWLAAQVQPTGVILQSPFRTIVRTLSSNRVLRHWDMFKNEEFIHLIHSPTAFIHGTQDEVCPFEHGKYLYEHCKAAHKRKLWIPKAGHNDIDQLPMRKEVYHLVVALRDKLKLGDPTFA